MNDRRKRRRDACRLERYTGPPLWNGELVPVELSVAELRERLKEKGARKWAAVVALGMREENEAALVLRELTFSRDAHERRAGLEALARHRSGSEHADRVLELLEDGDGAVVRTACRAAAELRLDAAHEAILVLLRDPIMVTRVDALESLRALWRPSDLPEVIRCLDPDEHHQVRRQAGWTLLELADDSNWLALFERSQADHLPGHRVHAARLADRFGGAAQTEALRILEQDPNGHVRKAASRAIAAIQGREAN